METDMIIFVDFKFETGIQNQIMQFLYNFLMNKFEESLEQIINLCSQNKSINSQQTTKIIITLVDVLKFNLSQLQVIGDMIQSSSTKQMNDLKIFNQRINEIQDFTHKKFDNFQRSEENGKFNKSEQISSIINEKIEQSNKNINAKFSSMIEKLEIEIKENKMEYETLKQRLQQENLKFYDVMAQIQKLQKKFNGQKFDAAPKLQIKQGLIDSFDWADSEGVHFNKLKFNNNEIIAKEWAYAIGKNKLSTQYSLTFIFQKIQNIVALGIIDTQYKKGQWGDQSNLVSYWNIGNGYVGAQKYNNQGLGFIKNERVQMAVDLVQGIIQWKVGEEIRHKIQYDKLKDSTVTYVPFIYLGNKDDCVLLFEE